MSISSTMDPLNEETMAPVGADGASDGWLKTFALCSIFSATLSIAGSSLILRRITLQSQRNNRTGNRSGLRSLLSCAPYIHLMLGLSVSDIFSSSTYAVFNFLDPQETSSFSWAIGNQQTCDAVGFLSQLALISLFYNAMLSFYYMLTIRFGVTEENFAKYWEPWLHLIVIGYPFSTAIYLLTQGLFEDVNNALSCWVNDPDIAWLFVGIPVVLIFIAIVGNNLTIYCYVRRTLRQSARYSTGGETTPSQSNNLQSVATMAFLYVGTFLLCYIWAYMTTIAEFYTDGGGAVRIFLRLMYHIFHPLQGFFNVLVFCRPRYLRYRKYMEQMHQNQLKRRKTSSCNSRDNDEPSALDLASTDFYQDEVATAPTYDITIQGALAWALVGPEVLPSHLDRFKTTQFKTTASVAETTANTNSTRSSVSARLSFLTPSFDLWKARSSTIDVSSTRPFEMTAVGPIKEEVEAFPADQVERDAETGADQDQN